MLLLLTITCKRFIQHFLLLPSLSPQFIQKSRWTYLAPVYEKLRHTNRLLLPLSTAYFTTCSQIQSPSNDFQRLQKNT